LERAAIARLYGTTGGRADWEQLPPAPRIIDGAAEFRRAADLAVVASSENIARLSASLQALQATVIAVPPFGVQYLDRGHGVPFRATT
jgi:hypothetical protein